MASQPDNKTPQQNSSEPGNGLTSDCRRCADPERSSEPSCGPNGGGIPADSTRVPAAAALNSEATRFILVGALNTLLGTALTFGFYNLAHMSYWLSSGLSYILASIFSFFMNKTFTFRNNDSILRSGLRFALNIAVCYGLAFGLAKPGVLLVLGRWPELSPKIIDNAALLTGMVLFTAFNFVGQKFFAFRKSQT